MNLNEIQKWLRKIQDDVLERKPELNGSPAENYMEWKLLETQQHAIQWKRLMDDIDASPALQEWWKTGELLRKLGKDAETE